MQQITSRALTGRYDAVLLDAYGVIVTQSGAIAGAADFLASLTKAEQAYFILTNDASRLPETIAKRFASFGLDIPVERIITSGSLIDAHFEHEGLRGARCLVLGTPDSHAYVQRAGGDIVPTAPDADADVLVVCDDSDYPFLPTVEAALTMVMRRFDAGRHTHLVLPNPDLIYPKGNNGYGFTSGSVALLLESAWRLRYAAPPQFVRLGKPHTPIFAAAAQRAGSDNLVLVGDQLQTDVRGARDYGIDSVLVGTGLTRWQPGVTLDPEPTYYLPTLAGF